MSSLFDSVLSQADSWKSMLLALPQNVQDYLVKNAQQIAADPAANARAAVAGGTKGITTDLAGGPVDLAASMYNQKFDPRNPTMLGAVNSATGYISDKLGQPKPALPEKPVGGSEWLADYAREKGAGPYIDQPPGTSDMVYEGSRILAPMAVGGTQVVGGTGARAPAGIPKSQTGLFGGVQSKTDLPKLREALDLSKQKVDMDTIRDKTGWFRDPGGQWQHEFAPSGGKFDWKHEFNRQDQEWQNKAEHIDQARWVASHMDRGMTPEQAAQTYFDTFKRSISPDAVELGSKTSKNDLLHMENLHAATEPTLTNFSTTLEKVYQNDELFKRYPELKELAFTFSSPKELGGAAGQYSLFGIDMLHQGRFPQQMSSTLEHEIQHAIQQRENWARGGSPEEFTTGAIGDRAFGIRQNLSQEVARLVKEADSAKSFDGRTKLLQKANAIKESISQFTPGGIYKRLLGEAQARTAERHLNMSPVAIKQERLKDMYDVKGAPLLLKKYE